MTHDKPTNKNLSLGTLRRAKKTKEKSPDCIGNLHIKRELLLRLIERLGEEEEVTANIAGWKQNGPYGPFMTIQLSSPLELSANSDVFADLV